MDEDRRAPGSDIRPFPPPPPPPPPDTPVYEPPGGAPPESPKPSASRTKRRGCIILAIVAAALLLAAAAWVVWAAVEDEAEVGEAMSQIEGHFVAIEEAILKVEEAWLVVEAAQDDEIGDVMESFEATVQPLLDEVLGEIAAAEHAAAQLDDSPMKDSLLEAFEESELAMQALKRLAEEAAAVAPLVQSVASTAKMVEEADTYVFEAIDKSNRDEYGPARKAAKKALELYDKALKELKAAEKANPGRELDKLIAVIAKSRKQAEVTLEAVDLAEDGDYGGYGEQVNVFNDLNREILDAELPNWMEDTALLTDGALAAYEEFLAHSDAAMEAMVRAEERYESGAY